MADKRTKKSATGHFEGKHTGATRLADGRIEPCPDYVTRFAKLTDRQNGLRELLNAVLKFEAAEMKSMAKEFRELWTKIADDLGFAPAEPWAFDGRYLIPPSPQTKEGGRT